MSIVSEIEAIVEPAWVALFLGDGAVVDTMASIGVELGDAERVCPVGLAADAVGLDSSPFEFDLQVISGPIAGRRIVVEFETARVLRVDDIVRGPIAHSYEA